MSGDWQVYLLLCRDGSLYCGSTTNLERRLAQHNGALPGGARYTRARRPTELLASVACPSRSEALKLEREIKSLPKTRKLQRLRRRANADA